MAGFPKGNTLRKGKAPWNKGVKKWHQLVGKVPYNANIKKQKLVTKFGYIKIYVPDHPRRDRDGYVFEHRIIVEKEIGRYLTRQEFVHHKNAKKNDNRPENLEIVTDRKHLGFVKCPYCVKIFRIK